MLNTFQQRQHDALPVATHDEASRQEFTKSLKGFIQSSLLPGLTPIFQNKVVPAFEREHGAPPRDRREIRKAMVRTLYFQNYAATNRIAQELLWESVNVSLDRQLPELLEASARLSNSTRAKLDIPQDFEAPRYVTALDIHCMPGGYATEITENDITAGAL